MASGSARVSVSHNIESVISDIDEVKDDIRHEMEKRVGAAMRVLWADAKQYVLNDPHTTGQLFSALQQDQNIAKRELEFRVYTDASIAPYAAIVEFGSGPRSDVAWRGAPNAGPPDEYPRGYPFRAPDIDNISGFAYYIEQWMKEKGVTPQYGSYRASALAIAKSINDRGNYAHPYLRPAWFDNELQVKRAARNALRNAVR